MKGEIVLDGKSLAASFEAEVLERSRKFKTLHQVAPKLAIVSVGDNPASNSYIRNKSKAAARAEVEVFHSKLGNTCSETQLAAEIEKFNSDACVHGILLQLPLPDGFPADKYLSLVKLEKDVDGLSPLNRAYRKVWPCTPRGILELIRLGLRQTNRSLDLAGLHCVVVGRSELVGRPIAELLQYHNATVTVCHSRTRNLSSITNMGDILVAAAGRPGLIGVGAIKPGAIVIDVGLSQNSVGKLVGDVDFSAVSEIAGAITPVPGGVGPMTVAMLLMNLLDLAER